MNAKNIDAFQRKQRDGKDMKTNPPVPRKYNIRLKTPEDVRRMLSVTLNLLRRGEIEVPVARTLIYGGQILLNVFEQGSLSEQLKELERRVNQED